MREAVKTLGEVSAGFARATERLEAIQTGAFETSRALAERQREDARLLSVLESGQQELRGAATGLKGDVSALHEEQSALRLNAASQEEALHKVSVGLTTSVSSLGDRLGALERFEADAGALLPIERPQAPIGESIVRVSDALEARSDDVVVASQS